MHQGYPTCYYWRSQGKAPTVHTLATKASMPQMLQCVHGSSAAASLVSGTTANRITTTQERSRLHVVARLTPSTREPSRRATRQLNISGASVLQLNSRLRVWAGEARFSSIQIPAIRPLPDIHYEEIQPYYIKVGTCHGVTEHMISPGHTIPYSLTQTPWGTGSGCNSRWNSHAAR